MNCNYCGEEIKETISFGYTKYSVDDEICYFTVCCSLACLINSLIVPHGFDIKSKKEIIENIKSCSD